MGGGSIPTDPRDGKGLSALERVFEFEALLPAAEHRVHIGQRINVRFDLGTEPLGFQLYRSVRQLFLRLFDV
jgi:putative peptide zinc metalloprotease protein